MVVSTIDVLEDIMQRFGLWIMLMFALVLFTFACGGQSTDETQEDKPFRETADTESHGNIPAQQPTGAGENVPGTVVGGAVTGQGAD